MRRHKAFPRPGDRIRLAVPHPTDESGPHARFGTVLERSCGRSNALRVRWDRAEVKATYGVDAGLETWLADAAWYWDKAQLEVVGGRHDEFPDAPAPAPARAPVSEEDAWLTASPRGAGSAVDGSLDAVAEWEAALASEIDDATGGSWEQLLTSALANGSPVAQAPRAPAPPQAQRRPAPAAPPTPAPAPVAEARVQAPTRHAAPPATAHKDIRKSTRALHEDADEPEPQPVAAPVKAWTGDDIIPRKSAKRWGRR